MPTFIVPYEWAVCGEINIEANTLKEAVEIVKGMDLWGLDITYIDGSFNVNPEMLALLNEDKSNAR